MVRIPNTSSAAPALAIGYATAATFITIIAISIFDLIAETDSLRTTEGRILKGGVILSCYFILFYFRFKKSIPSRIEIDNDGLRAKFGDKIEQFGFTEITDLKFIDNDDVLFLVIRIGKRKIKVEVTQGDIHRISTYLPMQLATDSLAS